MNNRRALIVIIIMGLLCVFFVHSSVAMFISGALGNTALGTAGWNVSLNQTGIENHISVIAEPSPSTATYTLRIECNAEVDAVYSIVLDNLPTGVKVKVDNGQFVQESNHKIIFSDVGTILYTDVNKTKTHTLTFGAVSGASFVNSQEVDISVIPRQILN